MRMDQLDTPDIQKGGGPHEQGIGPLRASASAEVAGVRGLAAAQETRLLAT
jgi:hypothetical protein